jgi:hypothetical protein
MEKIGEASKPLEARLAELNVSSQKTVVNSPLPKVLCTNVLILNCHILNPIL